MLRFLQIRDQNLIPWANIDGNYVAHCCSNDDDDGDDVGDDDDDDQVLNMGWVTGR